jgi:hypothetical protein
MIVILKVGHHLYDGHHLFGAKQQQTLVPSRDEQYVGFGSARWTARRSTMGSLGRLAVLAVAGRIIHGSRTDSMRPCYRSGSSLRTIRTIRALGRTVYDLERAVHDGTWTSSPLGPRSCPLGERP